MSCNTHQGHDHQHGEGCGHVAVRHDDHNCYLHDNHLHHMHGDHVDDHIIPVSGSNKAECTPGHTCADHDKEHKHASGCGHDPVPHGDHVDYLVSGHLHHSCADHCDDHGALGRV